MTKRTLSAITNSQQFDRNQTRRSSSKGSDHPKSDEVTSHPPVQTVECNHSIHGYFDMIIAAITAAFFIGVGVGIFLSDSQNSTAADSYDGWTWGDPTSVQVEDRR